MNRRLPWSLLLASLALNAMYAAVAGVLVPAQIALASPDSKETHLAMVMTASSLLTIVVHPWVGALSDRTRTRWGRRTPWIIAGAAGSAGALVALGIAESVVMIALGWLVVQPLLNVVEAPLDAVLADRVPIGQRPRLSAFYGGGAALGLAIGAGGAGFAVAHLWSTYVVLAVVLLATMVLFVVLNPEPATHAPHRSRAPRLAWAARDFRLVLVGRFVLVLGHQLVMGYLLYIVMDRTGRDAEDAGRLVTLIVGVHIAALVVGAVVAGHRVRQNRVRWVLLSTLVIALGLTFAVVWPGLGGLVAYAAVAGLGRGMYLTADLALMLDVLPSSGDHGRDLGVLGLATIVPQSLAPAVAGLVLAATGNAYGSLFVLAIAGVGLSALCISRVSSQVSSSP
ncbi:MFS transporter [Aeromicrobium sp. CF4.19]|uniref:MFS transporter n=1 Tax=Aeromicrobium sp. CF4.19 TaxID=3373082 RepID=UPI003EE64CF7